MSQEFGDDFISITDEDGKEYEQGFQLTPE